MLLRARELTKENAVEQAAVHGAPGQLSGEPFEGLLKVVVGLGRDVVVLQILLAMEVDLRKQTQGIRLQARGSAPTLGFSRCNA